MLIILHNSQRTTEMPGWGVPGLGRTVPGEAWAQGADHNLAFPSLAPRSVLALPGSGGHRSLAGIQTLLPTGPFGV